MLRQNKQQQKKWFYFNLLLVLGHKPYASSQILGPIAFSPPLASTLALLLLAGDLFR